MAISKLPVDLLIEEIKVKNPRLYQILKFLGDKTLTVSTDLDKKTKTLTETQAAQNVTLINHKDRHKSGGADAFTATDLLEAVVRRIQESSSDTILDIGPINEGQFLKRLGGKIIGSPPPEPSGNGGDQDLLATQVFNPVIERVVIQEDSQNILVDQVFNPVIEKPIVWEDAQNILANQVFGE